MKTQCQVILEHMESKFHPERLFTITEISREIDNKDKILISRLRSKSNADSPYWIRNYLQSIFHNASMRPKRPKILRAQYNGVYKYTLHRIISQPYI